MIGLMRTVKKSPLQSALIGTPPHLTGGIFLLGRIGTGKSCGMISLAQSYHDNPNRKYKILQLWGGDRNEQLYWAIKSNKSKYWSTMTKKLRTIQDGPVDYRVNFLYPMSNYLRKKLPKTDKVNSRFFTIPIKDIEPSDISLVIGTMSQTAEYHWREAMEHLKDKDNAADLINYFEKAGATNTTLYKNFVLPLSRHKLLSSKHSDYNLDIREEIKDREAITVLNLDHIEADLKLFVMGWILRKINQLLDDGKIGRKNIILLQEAAEFFRATDDSISPERYKVFRKMLSHYIRMGRRGVHLFMDAQSGSECKNLVDGSQDLTILGRLTSEADKEASTKQLYRDNLMTKKQITDLSLLNPGEYYIVESGKKAKKAYLFLPKTRFWEPGDGNFYDLWKKLGKEWNNITNDYENVLVDYETHVNLIKEKKKQAKLLKQLKEEQKEVTKELQKKKFEKKEPVVTIKKIEKPTQTEEIDLLGGELIIDA